MLCIVALNSISPASSAGVIASIAGLPKAFLMAASRFWSGNSAGPGVADAGVVTGVGAVAGTCAGARSCFPHAQVSKASRLTNMTPKSSLPLINLVVLFQIAS